MTVKIGKPIKQPIPPKNAFKVVITTVEGDADDYHTIDVLCKTEEDLLKVFNRFNELEEQDEDDWVLIEGEWTDSIYYNCDSDHRDGMHSFDVTWFNEDGIEHAVKLSKGKK